VEQITDRPVADDDTITIPHASALYNYILFDLIENTPVSSVPDALIQYVIDGKINYYLTSASYKQMPLEDYLAQFANASSLEEAVKNAFDKDIKNFKTYLVTQAIAEKAGIVVANDELPPDYANLTRDDETYENIYLKPYITQWVLKDKVVDYLTKHAIYE
jgi:FKBP-type peptidyl-prolyl cis-trans isomerase (trigger factor)